MRRLKSCGSVKAFWLERDELLQQLEQIAQGALRAFPEICEIRLFGSLARGEQSGMSDVDLLILTEKHAENPIERVRPYFFYFAQRLGMAVDVLVVSPQKSGEFDTFLEESLLLSRRSLK